MSSHHGLSVCVLSCGAAACHGRVVPTARTARLRSLTAARRLCLRPSQSRALPRSAVRVRLPARGCSCAPTGAGRAPQPSAAGATAHADTETDAGPTPGPGHWTTTWGTALIGTDRGSARSLSRVTLRQIIHTSVGGEQLRVRFSNAFGSSPLRIVSAHVALRKAGAAIALDSDRALTFAGASAVTLAVGATATSISGRPHRGRSVATGAMSELDDNLVQRHLSVERLAELAAYGGALGGF
jgi:hypothetical protein